MPQQRVRRIFKFLETLEKAPACSSREEAYELFHASWVQVNKDSTVPDKDIENFQAMRLSAENGWMDLENDPCHLPSVEHTGLRVYLHNNGQIVIQDLSNPVKPILLAKLGTRF